MDSLPITQYKNVSCFQPLIPGIGDIIAETIQDTALAAGANTKNFSSVPVGKLYIYKSLSMRYLGTAPARLVFSQMIDAVEYIIFAQTPPVTSVVYDRQGEWAVKAGDNLRVSILNATLNDDIFLYATGWSVDILGI